MRRVGVITTVVALVVGNTLAEPIYHVGDQVMARDSDRPWRPGVVTNAEPLEVRPEGWSSAVSWDEVRLVNSPTAPTTKTATAPASTTAAKAPAAATAPAVTPAKVDVQPVVVSPATTPAQGSTDDDVHHVTTASSVQGEKADVTEVAAATTSAAAKEAALAADARDKKAVDAPSGEDTKIGDVNVVGVKSAAKLDSVQVEDSAADASEAATVVIRVPEMYKKHKAKAHKSHVAAAAATTKDVTKEAVKEVVQVTKDSTDEVESKKEKVAEKVAETDTTVHKDTTVATKTTTEVAAGTDARVSETGRVKLHKTSVNTEKMRCFRHGVEVVCGSDNDAKDAKPAAEAAHQLTTATAEQQEVATKDVSKDTKDAMDAKDATSVSDAMAAAEKELEAAKREADAEVAAEKQSTTKTTETKAKAQAATQAIAADPNMVSVIPIMAVPMGTLEGSTDFAAVPLPGGSKDDDPLVPVLPMVRLSSLRTAHGPGSKEQFADANMFAAWWKKAAAAMYHHVKKALF